MIADRVARLPDYYRPLRVGELVQQHDYVRLGSSYVIVRPCRYEREGEACCVGRAVTEAEAGTYFRDAR